MKIDLKSLLIGFGLGTAPFWFAASDLTDMSEAKSTGIGVVIIGIIQAINKLNKSE